MQEALAAAEKEKERKKKERKKKERKKKVLPAICHCQYTGQVFLTSCARLCIETTLSVIWGMQDAPPAKQAKKNKNKVRPAFCSCHYSGQVFLTSCARLCKLRLFDAIVHDGSARRAAPSTTPMSLGRLRAGMRAPPPEKTHVSNMIGGTGTLGIA